MYKDEKIPARMGWMMDRGGGRRKSVISSHEVHKGIHKGLKASSESFGRVLFIPVSVLEQEYKMQRE